MQIMLKRLIFVLLLIAVWEGLFQLNIWPETMLPSPVDVFITLWIRLIDLTLVYDLLASLRHLLIGFTIALCLGTLLGILLARVKAADETLGLFVLAFQSVPSIVWLPLAIMWFGLTDKAIIFIVVLGGTFVMTINMRIGLKNVSPVYLKAARTMGSSGIDLFFKVMIPASVPHAVTGIRLAWAFGWRALMAGELLSTGPGLGYTLKYASDFGDMPLVIGVMVLIGVIGITADQLLFNRIEKKVMSRWGMDTVNY